MLHGRPTAGSVSIIIASRVATHLETSIAIYQSAVYFFRNPAADSSLGMRFLVGQLFSPEQDTGYIKQCEISTN
jgi:hypothetical protein